MKKKPFVNKKWIVILVIIALLVTFDLLDDQKSISTRAIVLAMSLDKGQNERYNLGIQLLKTDKNNNQEYLNFYQEGDSVSDILETMNYNVGATVSLAHTMVIVISQDILLEDKDEALRYLLENQVVTYNTMLVTSGDKPDELMSAKLSNGIGSGYYLGQVLRTVAADFGVVPVSIKDYFMLRYRIGGCIYMPYVTLEKQGENSYLDLTKMYATDGQKGLILDEDATKGLSLVATSLSNGSLTYRYADITGEADIVQSFSNISVKNDSAKITVYVSLRDTSNVPDSIDETKCLEDIDATLKGYINKCYEDCKAQNLDIFYLGQYCYAFKNPLANEAEYLDKLTVDIVIDGNLK